MAVVAVLETNIDSTKVLAMTPSSTMDGRSPRRVRKRAARRRSTPVWDIPAARTKPPKKSQTRGWPITAT
jgi:hypothetical protein